MSAGTATRRAHVLVAHDELRGMMRDAFRGAGLTADDAEAVAEVLADANLRGIESHGVERAPIYLRRLLRGLAAGTGGATVTLDTPVLCQIDAGHALGPAISVRAIDRAVDMARAQGIGLVAVGRSTHFGAAGFYARRAAAAGLISYVASNAAGTMAPHGGADRFLGANPFAIGVPMGRHGEFVLDMSTSIAARGRIRRAEALGMPLPEGLAIDPDGAPTTDPAAALAGCVLPVGGPKGTGLALAITLMTGILAGADFDDEMDSMYADFERPQNIGHVFWAIDPARFADPDEARARVEALIDRYHAVRPAQGSAGVIYAGERQARLASQRLREGIPVARVEIDRLADAAADGGLTELAAAIRRAADAAPLVGR